MSKLIRNLLRDTNGSTAVEYGLMAGMIAIVIIGAVTSVGTQASSTYNKIATALKAVNAS